MQDNNGIIYGLCDMQVRFVLFVWFGLFSHCKVSILKLGLHIFTFSVLNILRFMYTANHVANFSYKIAR